MNCKEVPPPNLILENVVLKVRKCEFTLDYSQKVSLKFEGTIGKIKNISITTMRIKQFNNHIVLLNDNINHVD